MKQEHGPSSLSLEDFKRKVEETLGIVLIPDAPIPDDVADRAKRMKPKSRPEPLEPIVRSVHFLRGVHSRSGFCIPAYYLFLATSVDATRRSTVDGYPGTVLQSYLHQSSFNYLAMVCRKAFDHATGAKLTGANFAKTTGSAVLEHAQYWAEPSKASLQEAQRGLDLLRRFFRLFSKQEPLLLASKSVLSRRIGLIKQYANRSAAHISLGTYELRALDLAHFMSEMVVVGAIIGRFDDPARSDSYYDNLDKASHEASLALFPDTYPTRLFHDKNISQSADQLLQTDNDDDLLAALDELAFKPK